MRLRSVRPDEWQLFKMDARDILLGGSSFGEIGAETECSSRKVNRWPERSFGNENRGIPGYCWLDLAPTHQCCIHVACILRRSLALLHPPGWYILEDERSKVSLCDLLLECNAN
jgi:hypothetical protein